MRVSVIVPTLNPGSAITELADSFAHQTLRPTEVILVDSASDTLDVMQPAWRVIRVRRSEFDHGGTRNLAARAATSSILVFMTQDAVPADETTLEALVAPLADGRAAATYARQLPRPGADPLEGFARSFNYPATSHRKTIADLPWMGVKTFFFSNVCSAVVADDLWAVGGFPESIVMNEDMVLCAKLLRAGRAVEYAAEARVLHSHRYSLAQQFRRNFDVGAFMTSSAGVMEGARTASEGARFVGQQIAYLLHLGRPDLVPRSMLENAAKLAGFGLGRRADRLPAMLRVRLGMNQAYWARETPSGSR